MSWIISRIVGQKFHDVSCGFRAYSRKTILRMNLFGKFTYTQESFIDFAYKNIPIIELPMKVKSKREHGKSKISSNLFKYGFQTMKIIIMAVRDYKPMKFMGIISLLCVIIGGSVGAFFLAHYIRTGMFKPHTWAGFMSGTFFALALLFLIVGIFLEMFSQNANQSGKTAVFCQRTIL